MRRLPRRQLAVDGAPRGPLLVLRLRRDDADEAGGLRVDGLGQRVRRHRDQALRPVLVRARAAGLVVVEEQVDPIGPAVETVCIDDLVAHALLLDWADVRVRRFVRWLAEADPGRHRAYGPSLDDVAGLAALI